MAIRMKFRKWISASIALSMSIGGAMNVEAQNRLPTIPDSCMPIVGYTQYADSDIEKIVSVYKAAYLAAGFRLKKKTVNKSPAGYFVAKLYFVLVIEDPPYSKAHSISGTASFIFQRSPIGHGYQKNSYSEVGREIFGDEKHNDGSHFTNEDWNVLFSKMLPADKKARIYIIEKLGRSVPSVDPER